MSEQLDHLIEQPLAAIAAAIKGKQVTSIALVQAMLERIDSVNSELNALVTSNADNALKYAAKADEDLKNGTLQGPLHGVPMTIKDSLDTRDTVTTWGSRGRESFVPGRDATVVARLRDAGAILLGKTNTPEFTLSFQTDNLIFGASRNPYDTSRTPGGSSGGAAALIAAGASLFDVGTDTGGSIRLPAHFCGITGIKPTTGRLPCTGNALPSSGLLARLSQPGPMARNTKDLEYLLSIMAGPDLIDPNTIAVPLGVANDVDLSQLRVAFHTENGIKTPQDDIVAAIKHSVDLLQQADFAVTEARPSGIEMTSLIFSRLFAADGGDMVIALLEDCRTTEPSPRIAAMLEAGVLEMKQQEFARIIDLWDNYRSSMLAFFNDFDVLICPVNGQTAIPIGEDEEMANYTYTNAFNLTGWPAAVVRGGTDGNGLPIGIQVVAAPFREDHCLAVARWLESALGPFSHPAIFSGQN